MLDTLTAIPEIEHVLVVSRDQAALALAREYGARTVQESGTPKLNLHLLQCRPQNQFNSDSREIQSMTTDLAPQDKILVCTRMVPQGRVSQIEYIVYVDAHYYQLDSLKDHSDVARCIGQLNNALEGHPFILIGPGRWGSSDSMQGVPVTYADIFNTRALVEVASRQSGFAAEPSYGTHQAIGFGAAGLVIFSQSGEEGAAGFLLVFVGSAALTAIFLGIAAWIAAGGAATRRARTLAIALVVRFAMVVLFDVVALGLASLLPSGTASRLLIVAVIVNPVDAVRTGALLAIEGAAAFGAGSLAFLRFTQGSTGAGLLLVASLVVWTVLPALAALSSLRRADV